MYYPQGPKEPSGCVQTFIISRLILGIIFVPTVLVFGAIVLILTTFYALTISPFLALAIILGGAGIVLGVARWEWKRISKEIPPDDS